MVRTRKRVGALRRAPDGSGFLNCDECRVSVPVALMDMHNCKVKKDLKRFKGKTKTMFCKDKLVYEEPRSPFLFFMESYAKTCRAQDLVEINRQAFQIWKNMSTKEQWPFVLHAQKVDNVYLNLLHQEMNDMSQGEDDEADSALVGKVALQFEDYDNSDGSECWDTCDCRSSTIAACFDEVKDKIQGFYCYAQSPSVIQQCTRYAVRFDAKQWDNGIILVTGEHNAGSCFPIMIPSKSICHLLCR
ncbi:hypothetical protein KSS87_011408 [Heliosperma pusillum]|nr:hypothetical protein KSS87_011408 [Heliosperma pusillum]